MRLIDADAFKNDIMKHMKKPAHSIFGLIAGIEEAEFLETLCKDIDKRPTVEPERKWETCFDCPLSNGCPKIRGCTNEQAEGYASDIPDDCPLSIDPERKTGKWIEDTDQNHIEKCWYCSECGYKAWGQYEKTDFCGGCGAKME